MTLPDKVALTWYQKGSLVESMTYQILWQSVEATAAKVEAIAQPGERVLLLFEPGLSFIICFYACLRARVVAVPAYPPMPANPQRGIEIISKVIENACITCVITSESVQKLKFWKGKWPTVLHHSGEMIHYYHWPKSAFRYSSHAASASTASAYLSSMSVSSDIAFLQYTSGSTGDPKGVIIGHDNFQYNIASSVYWLTIDQTTGTHQQMKQDIVCTSWLPIYHDMGLTIGLSHPLCWRNCTSDVTI